MLCYRGLKSTIGFGRRRRDLVTRFRIFLSRIRTLGRLQNGLQVSSDLIRNGEPRGLRVSGRLHGQDGAQGRQIEVLDAGYLAAFGRQRELDGDPRLRGGGGGGGGGRGRHGDDGVDGHCSVGGGELFDVDGGEVDVVDLFLLDDRPLGWRLRCG